MVVGVTRTKRARRNQYRPMHARGYEHTLAPERRVLERSRRTKVRNPDARFDATRMNSMMTRIASAIVRSCTHTNMSLCRLVDYMI